MGRSLGFIAAGVCLVVVLTGCGGSKTVGAAEPVSAKAEPAVSAATWVDGFCGSLLGIGALSGEDGDRPQIKPGDIEGSRKAMAEIFAKGENAIGSAVDGLGKLPAAPVAAGDTAKTKLLDVLVPVLQKIKDARSKFDAAPATDPQSILDAVAALKPIGTDLHAADDPLQDIKASPELEAARKSAPNCLKLPE